MILTYGHIAKKCLYQEVMTHNREVKKKKTVVYITCLYCRGMCTHSFLWHRVTTS